MAVRGAKVDIKGTDGILAKDIYHDWVVQIPEEIEEPDIPDRSDLELGREPAGDAVTRRDD